MLTESQKKEAEWLYIINRLNEFDLGIMKRVEEVNRQLKHLDFELKSLQEECSHPLIAREYINRGYSGHWDNDSNYWTDHTCRLCGLKWMTKQDWQYRGSKLGLPE